MRKLALCMLLAFIVTITVGCGAQMHQYIIKIDGTEGTQFEGVYMYQVETTPHSEKFSGTVPAEYPFEAELVSAEVIQKSEGSIKVSLEEDGQVISEQEVSGVDQSAKVLSD